MILNDYFEVTRPMELPTIEELNKYEQQYTNLLNSDVPDEEKGSAFWEFGCNLFRLGDEMSAGPYSKEVVDETLKLGIKLLLKGAEFDNPDAKKLLDYLSNDGRYKDYGVPSKSNTR